MAFTWANRGIYTLLSSAISGTTDIRQAVFTGTVPDAATVRVWNTLADVIADAGSAEAVAAGYARAVLAGVAVAEDDATNKATLVATAPTYGPVAAGETWTFAAVYIEGADDASRALLGIDAPPVSQPTNGGNITGPALSVGLVGAST